MKKIIISGGGTGGHIYPGITIAREILQIEEAEILFVGTPLGMEAKIIPQEGFDFFGISSSGLKRNLSFENFKTVFKTFGSVWKAKKLIKSFKPDVVVGTGGYVCGPVLLAAALSGIPTLIQEQNVIPGITNKILSRFVDKIALGYEDAKFRFKYPEKCIYTGNPVRREIIDAKREESRQKLNIDKNAFMVLIAGGSRGARAINNAMIEVHNHFKNTENLCLYHVTGDKEYENVMNVLNSGGEKKYGKSSIIVGYQHDMPTALAASDLVIYRAGAIGLAELAAKELPSILIPYPYASEDHQTYNARVFVAAGASKMIVDKHLTGKELIQDIEDLIANPDILRYMSEATKKVQKINAGQEIAKLVFELSKWGKR